MLRFGTRLRSHRTSIRFKDRRDEGKLSQFTLDFLDALATGAGVKHVVVTSTSRTALEQARVMYDKLATGKVDSYRAPGQAVQRVGRQGIDAGQGRSSIVEQMVTEIEKVGLVNVSQHAGVHGLDVCDLGISTIEPKQRGQFVSLARTYYGWPIYKFGHPHGPKPGTRFEFRDHGCFHLAVMQPEEIDRIRATA